jgi:hypothetical protein
MEMEGCEMSTVDRTDVEDERSQYRSAAELTITKQLSAHLPRHFVLEKRSAAIEVPLAVGQSFSYLPDLLVKNIETGEVLPVEVKTQQSLSLANVVKLKFINSAYKEMGKHFLLVVCALGAPDTVKKRRVRDEGIDAIWTEDGIDAAAEIAKVLAPGTGG